MRNLFVCHTQAHLILACGLSKGRFKNDQNHLILFRDFNLNDELRGKLETFFTSTLFLTGGFPASNKSFKARLKWHREDNRLLKQHIQQPYDRVFAVCDWTPPVQYCLKRCRDLNENTEFIWLEDGILSYFPNVVLHKGFDKYKFTMYLRKILFKYLMGIGSIYDRDFNEMGGLKIFHQMYTLYPEAVREPYRSSRELVKIEDEEYLAGVKTLYNTRQLDISDGSILLLIDKLDTYIYPDKVQASIARLKAKAQAEGKKIFCKFHPREDMEWPVFEGCTILERTIGAESLYLSLIPQKDSISIVGIKSAGLMSAKKMGFDVITLFSECGETNPDLVKFFTNLGCEFLG